VGLGEENVVTLRAVLVSLVYLAMLILVILHFYIRFIFLAKKSKYFYAKGSQSDARLGVFFFFAAVTLKSSVLWDVTPCGC
jgi:hypothetical protein